MAEDGLDLGLSRHRRNASLVLPRNGVQIPDRDLHARSRWVSLSSRWLKPETEEETERSKSAEEIAPAKKGIWNWRPVRALTHLTMQKLSCLFAVDVITVQNLPPSINGFRLAVAVRKKESKDGRVQTTPSRVLNGAADFEETLFVKCHVYFSPGGGIHVKFEPRPFLFYVVAVDAPELSFGRSSLDFSALIQESIATSFEGTRIKQWDKRFGLSGKAKGGELVLKLGFQIMEKDGGFRIYSQKSYPKTASTPSLSSKKVEETEDDLPEFEIVDKGVEIEENSRSVTSEIVKEVVRDQFNLVRLSELDSIVTQIKGLMGEKETEILFDGENSPSRRLDADEDKVTRKFLKLLEMKDIKSPEDLNDEDDESDVFLPDLGKGLGCVVQTRNGGFLVAMNPLQIPVDNPKLAMQFSKPVVIPSENASGFEVFRRLVALGLEEFTTEIMNSMSVDELYGKTAERVAFEGIAAAIIAGRNKEGANSSAARTIAAVKSVAKAVNTARREMIPTGVLTVDEILPFSMHKIEKMAVEALKIQAETAETEAPFAVSPDSSPNDHFSAVSLEDWIKIQNPSNAITISVVVQLHDPLRQYEAVGGPMIAVVQATAAGEEEEDEEKKYKVVSIQIGGVKVWNLETKTSWDGEKQKVTALQWLVAKGLVKGTGKKGKRLPGKQAAVLWSLAALVVADTWLKPSRDYDVVFANP